MEATAWENGFVPEGRGLPAVALEERIVGSLPHIACMVSRPRQPTDAGESGSADLLRCANIVQAMKSRRSSPSPM